MKPILLLIGLLISLPAYTRDAPDSVDTVVIPYMDRAALHREYANTLLELALSLSEDRYGPYDVVQQSRERVIRRQLLELIEGENLSVAISMPMPDWLDNARRVPFPIMKGLASYRMFIADEKNLAQFNRIDSLEALKTLDIGQGAGWSTANILEDNNFQVVYGGPYDTLLPMLKAGRFQLLMRGIYEARPELAASRETVPGLDLVEDIAVFTYLPMYFFVSEDRPRLAERLEYGLIQAHKSGELDKLFHRYFGEAATFMEAEKRTVFYLPNNNIDASFYENDRPYLLESVNRLKASNRSSQ